MQNSIVKTHTDGIWVSTPKEVSIIDTFSSVIQQNNFKVLRQDDNNYGRPYIYSRGDQILDCRFVDSVFLEHPDAWTKSSFVITDNITFQPIVGEFISVLPEFWSIWHFNPQYQDRKPTRSYNCFMNRVRGDRSVTFYELMRRNILDRGLVSFNVSVEECEQQYQQAELMQYSQEHSTAIETVPYNNLTGTLEQCIIDSNISLILETYISDTHIVFSEKLFRCLQMPRPWLLYCSPSSIKHLREYGFDLLDDYVDHNYDNIIQHSERLLNILDQLETFVDRQYSAEDYTRFTQAAAHNQKLLFEYSERWPEKFNSILEKVSKL